MDTQITISFVLIGLAAIAAGSVGILLPPGERLAAALPRVVGTGIGLVTLAVGANGARSNDDLETVFLLGSALGFASTALTLAVLWRPTHLRRETP
ncbi:MAG: hypothetical protein ACXWEH_03910 [Actinomycetota bacterium]